MNEACELEELIKEIAVKHGIALGVNGQQN